MEAKSRQRAVRLSQDVIRHVILLGEKVTYPAMPENVPRIVGKRNKGDEKFLSTNKLHLLQRFFKA